jgi:hypothetical protein
MLALALQTLLLLFRVDWIMHRSGMDAVQELVAATRPANSTHRRRADHICYVVDLVSVFYFKPVLCLQRSVTTALLLRRYGHAGELVIGARIMPFRSHAWVEIEGKVVNDKPYMSQLYQELARC